VGAIARAVGRLVHGEIPPPSSDRLREYSYPPVAERMADVVERAIARRPYP
jgi:hypothetical protein